MLHVMLCSLLRTFERCVQCQIWLFSVVPSCYFDQLISMILIWLLLPQFLLMSLLFLVHMHCTSIVRSLLCRIFSAFVLITIRSPEIAVSINRHVPFHYNGL